MIWAICLIGAGLVGALAAMAILAFIHAPRRYEPPAYRRPF